MTPLLRPFLLLALVLAPACAPSSPFAYSVEPGPALDRLRTVALDPRGLAWVLEGQRAVDPGEFRAPVAQELRGKGFRFVQADAAELWLDLIAMEPASARPVPVAKEGEGEGRGRRGQGCRGGGRQGGEAAVPMRHPSGGLTLIVKLVSCADEKTLWYGSVKIPAPKQGQGAQRGPEDWVRQLLQPLPARTGAATSAPEEATP